MNKRTESRALCEVRQWKAACADDVSGLDPTAALRRRLRDSANKSQELGFTQVEQSAQKVAEDRAEYNTNEQK